MSNPAQPLRATKQPSAPREANGTAGADRSALLATLLHITGRFAGILEFEPLIEQIACQTQALLGCREVALLIVEGDQLVYRACAGQSLGQLGDPLPLHGDSLPAQALRLGTPVQATQAST